MRCTLILLLLIVAAPLHATQQGALPLHRLHLESEGIGDSGSIVVDGVQSAKGMASLSIQAFGKHLQLNTSQLNELQGGFYNFAQLSYEHAHLSGQGRTLYIKLGTGYTSGENATVLVRVREDGGIEIIKPANAA